MISKYRIFDPQVDRPLHLLPRKEARAAYNRFIAAIPERIEMLKFLADKMGLPILDGSGFLEPLHDLYYQFCYDLGENSPLTDLEYSIANDISMYLGDLVTTECESLRWTFNIFGRTNQHCHRPVIMGFKKVENKNYSVDYDLAINAYGHRIIQRLGKEDRLLLRMYESALSKA